MKWEWSGVATVLALSLSRFYSTQIQTNHEMDLGYIADHCRIRKINKLYPVSGVPNLSSLSSAGNDAGSLPRSMTSCKDMLRACCKVQQGVKVQKHLEKKKGWSSQHGDAWCFTYSPQRMNSDGTVCCWKYLDWPVPRSLIPVSEPICSYSSFYLFNHTTTGASCMAMVVISASSSWDSLPSPQDRKG